MGPILDQFWTDFGPQDGAMSELKMDLGESKCESKSKKSKREHDLESNGKSKSKSGSKVKSKSKSRESKSIVQLTDQLCPRVCALRQRLAIADDNVQ